MTTTTYTVITKRISTDRIIDMAKFHDLDEALYYHENDAPSGPEADWRDFDSFIVTDAVEQNC